MKRKFTLMMILLLLLGSFSFGQTASLATITASPGEDVIVPLNVTDFNNIGAISLNIRYNSDVLTFTGITGGPAGMIGNSTDSTVHIAWNNNTPITVSGNLTNLHFFYNGPGTSRLRFIIYGPQKCEVIQMPGNIPLQVTYTDGQVGPFLLNTARASLISQTGIAAGSPVTVPLHYEGFGANVSAISQKIHYDPDKMTFLGLTSTGTLAAGTIYNVNPTTGIISIAWTNTTGTGINFPGNFYELNFVYQGYTTTAIEFYPGCMITDNVSANIPVSYFNGTVTPVPTPFNATIGSITGAVQGQIYNVPLDLSGFLTGPGGPAAISLNINFDSPRISFLGFNNMMYPGQTIVNQVGSTLSIAYSNITLPTPSVNGTFMNLQFRYNGVGTADIDFGVGCVFSDFAGQTLTVNFTDGSITPGVITGHNAWIGCISATQGDVVSVPVSFSEMPVDSVGGISLIIGFDDTKLIFIDGQNFPAGALVNRVGNKIYVAWASITPLATINGLFGDLRFIYDGGGLPAVVEFLDGCEVSAVQGGVLIPVNWHNCGVNLKYKISGILQYDGMPTFPNTVLANFKVYLKSSAEPIVPNTTPVAIIIDSTMTDANGYFEFMALNGTYYLYGGQSATWDGVGPPDVTHIRRYIAGLSNPITGDPLRVRAVDINQDGFVDPSDITPLRRRLANLLPNPNYLAPDWLFTNPGVIVNNGPVANQDVFGICSGDANGSYPDPNN